MSRFVKDILDVKNVLGASRESLQTITLFTVAANPFLYQVTCNGQITITTIVSGTETTATYTDLNNTYIALSADANTDIVITGKVTHLRPHNTNTENHTYTKLSVVGNSLTSLMLYNCKDLHDIDVTQAEELVQIDADYIFTLPALDLSQNTKLQHVAIGYDYALTEIDLGNSPDLSYLQMTQCHNISKIKVRALNSSVVSNVISLINANSGLAGTVYLNTDDTYFSNIATAAVNAGWTVAAL